MRDKHARYLGEGGEMAEQRSSIFNKTASDRLRSPDDLDRYVRVTTPSAWVALFAVLALVLGLLSWGVFGSVSTSVSAVGTCVDGRVVCLLSADEAAQVSEGDSAYVAGMQSSVVSIDSVPLSLDEVRQLLKSDYLADALVEDDWSYLVTFDQVAVENEGVPISVSITTERVAPISLILG